MFHQFQNNTPIENQEHCQNCQNQRHNLVQGLLVLEQNLNHDFCPFQKGLSKFHLHQQVAVQIENGNNQIDVLIIQKGHNGDNREVWSQPDPDTVQWAKDYYFPDQPISTHQQSVRDLVEALESIGMTWQLTDLVKCFIKDRRDDIHNINQNQAENNFQIAATNCMGYLTNEITNLDPKIIIILNNDVGTFLQQQEIIQNFDGIIIETYQPTKNTSDLWVKIGRHTNLLRFIIRKLLDQNINHSYTHIGVQQGNVLYEEL